MATASWVVVERFVFFVVITRIAATGHIITEESSEARKKLTAATERVVAAETLKGKAPVKDAHQKLASAKQKVAAAHV